MDIITEIQHKKTATISLKELAELSHNLDYGEFVAEINGCIEEGLLRPFGKETNGMFPPPIAARIWIQCCKPSKILSRKWVYKGTPSGALHWVISIMFLPP